MEGDPRFRQQFARDFRVRRSCLLAWLHYLQRHHPGYRDIAVPQGPVEEAVEEDPSDADASAIPNLQVSDTELNALQSRFLDAAANARVPYPPRLQEWKAAPEAARMVLSRQLLRDNAHIAAYHFHKRYTLFRTIVLKQKFNLTDFWGRYEWQGRGSSHHHGLYWLSGHPDLDPDNDQSREQFTRIWGYHVSAVNPEPQRIQGERNDGQINHYNRLLTVAWLANTDVSPCTSLQQVIDYAAKYCSKSEKKSESFAQIGKALMPRVKDHNPLISFTSKLLNQLVAERDYSKQEVSHLLLGLPLQEGSRTCLDPSKWKQWQPVNVNGRPRQQWPDYCRAFSYCWQHHSHGDDHYGRPKEARLHPQDDQYEALPVEEEFDDEDWIRLAALLPGNPLTQEDLDLLGRRDIDVNYDWTRHPPHGQRCGGPWPHWRNTLNPQQRLVYDTFMGHFQAKNPTQILLHVDGGGGTGKSFLIKSRLRHVKYLVIDEKSMLGIEQLARIDSRLRQAFPQRSLEFFGGRQAGDDQAQFRQALQELREVKLSIPSWNLLSSRVQARLTQSEVDSFRAALRVYSTRARVEAKNQGKGAGQAPSDNAGNLSNKFPVAKGARGTVYDIAWNAGAEPLEDPPAVIMVDFDSYDGPPYLTTNEGRKISPILPSLTKDQIVTDLAHATSRPSLYNHTPTEGMKMRLADQQRRQGQQLSDAPYPPLYLD
ncbi:PIF1-like helicase [Hirsutella rhossiliensis]